MLHAQRYRGLHQLSEVEFRAHRAATEGVSGGLASRVGLGSRGHQTWRHGRRQPRPKRTKLTLAWHASACFSPSSMNEANTSMGSMPSIATSYGTSARSSAPSSHPAVRHRSTLAGGANRSPGHRRWPHNRNGKNWSTHEGKKRHRLVLPYATGTTTAGEPEVAVTVLHLPPL